MSEPGKKSADTADGIFSWGEVCLALNFAVVNAKWLLCVSKIVFAGNLRLVNTVYITAFAVKQVRSGKATKTVAVYLYRFQGSENAFFAGAFSNRKICVRATVQRSA